MKKVVPVPVEKIFLKVVPMLYSMVELWGKSSSNYMYQEKSYEKVVPVLPGGCWVFGTSQRSR